MEKHSSLFFKGVGDEETTLQLGGSLAFNKLNMRNEGWSFQVEQQI